MAPAEQWAQVLRAWQAGACAEVLALLAPSLDASQPADDVLQLAALAHQRLGELPQALQRQQQWVDRHPQQAAGWINLANIQADLGQVDAGLDSLARALALDPQQAAAHFNRGNLLMRQGDAGAAFDAFRRAGELAPERPDPLCNQAQALCALGRFGEALAIMQSVVARYPGLAAGWNGLGMVWHRLSDDAQALRSYQRAVQIDANLVDAWSNAAQVLARLERPDEAAQWARRAVELGGGQAAARTLGVVLVSDRQNPEARQWLEQALQRDPGDTVALNNLLTLDSVQCDWDALDRHLQALRTQWQQGRIEGLQPWRLLSLPVGAAELRAVTEQDCARRFAHVAPTEPGRWRVHVGKPRPARLRVGYFSSDFHQHATSVLMAGLFERHDRSRFEVFGLCLGRYRTDAPDPMRARVQAAFEHFEAVGRQGDPQVIERARALDLHIAVDLKGYTHQSRPRLFAERMAPIQMHYIGYPGTLGMPGAIDYQVADRIVVPPEARDGYSEKIIELPVSYQANDRTRMMDPQVPARAALGLPDGAFVFCCFNNNYKITREVFALWMDLLRERPGSVLWLLAEQGDAQRNLRAAAAAQGVDPARLVFAERAPLPQHLARHAQADLFLDTWPCNAHTTASDALWAGLPLITHAGSTFASRVAASLLHACELPQLVADSPQAYRALALSLSAAPERLQAIRRQLMDTRQTLPLFDAERFARHLERAFDLAWERHVRGQPPDHLVVAPLPQ